MIFTQDFTGAVETSNLASCWEWEQTLAMLSVHSLSRILRKAREGIRREQICPGLRGTAWSREQRWEMLTLPGVLRQGWANDDRFIE